MGGGGGERPFFGQGGLLGDLRAEVNCREGKRRKEREGREREREGSVSGLALLPSPPWPSPLRLRFFIWTARGWTGRFRGLFKSMVWPWGHRLLILWVSGPTSAQTAGCLAGFLAASGAPGLCLLSHFPILGSPDWTLRPKNYPPGSRGAPPAFLFPRILTKVA